MFLRVGLAELQSYFSWILCLPNNSAENASLSYAVSIPTAFSGWGTGN
jgi:hypothetical protein